MKIINYNYGYNNFFNCSIHGKIIMTQKELDKAVLFLLRGAKRWMPSSPWIKEVLKKDLERKVQDKKGYRINIRVPATEVLVEKFGLQDKYKRGNYMLQVIG